MKRTIVIAIGGNSLITDPKNVTVPAQYHAAYQTAQNLFAVLDSDSNIAIVHGNGPQVGFVLRRAQLARHVLHPVPLDSCVADTQGALGYNIQTAIRNVLTEENTRRNVATIVTEVLVDKDDPSFTTPSKPIGSFMTAEEAQKRHEEDGWDVAEDAGRGWRWVVASPRPIEILELPVIRQLVESGVITIAAGGGGIPVVDEGDGTYSGVAAVIDKDRAAALLARELDADRFVISTAVEKVFINFGTPQQQSIDTMTVTEARGYIAEGHFAPGSMLPKIEAMIDFVEHTGCEGLITDPEHLAAALEGTTGTRIVP